MCILYIYIYIHIERERVWVFRSLTHGCFRPGSMAAATLRGRTGETSITKQLIIIMIIMIIIRTSNNTNNSHNANAKTNTSHNNTSNSNTNKYTHQRQLQSHKLVAIAGVAAEAVGTVVTVSNRRVAATCHLYVYHIQHTWINHVYHIQAISSRP